MQKAKILNPIKYNFKIVTLKYEIITLLKVILNTHTKGTHAKILWERFLKYFEDSLNYKDFISIIVDSLWEKTKRERTEQLLDL